MNQVYYFIEDFDPALDYRDGICVALNPVPLYELRRRGIPYRIMEDFYDEKELRSREGQFFYEELNWFKQFDEWIQERFDYCAKNNLNLATAYYNRIKYFVNSLIIQSYILNSIVKELGADSKILYVKKHGQSPQKKTFRGFRLNEASLSFAEILPVICKKHSVNYTFHLFNGYEAQSDKKVSTEKISLKSVVKRLASIFKSKKSAGKPGLNVLFLHSGSLILDPAIEIFSKKGGNIFFYREEVLSAELEECGRLSRAFTRDGKAIIDWISRHCGFDAADFVLPYFQSFLSDDCSQMIIQARKLRDFYEANKVDYVVSHTSADMISKSALLAAQLRPSVKTVCIQHGNDVFVDKGKRITEINAFDYFLTMDSLSQKRYAALANEDQASSCQIIQSPHFLNAIRSGIKEGNRGKKRILYIPTKLVSVHTRYFNCMVYPILWYLEFQKKLFDYLAANFPDYEFIYKQNLNRTSFVDKTVLPYIKERGYTKIKVDTRSVVECLSDVDAAFMDRPSTAFFEAMMSGLPTLSIYPDFVSNVLDMESVHYFGKCLQSFSTAEEAFKIVGDFLQGKASDYQKRVPLHDDGFLQFPRPLKGEGRVRVVS